MRHPHALRALALAAASLVAGACSSTSRHDTLQGAGGPSDAGSSSDAGPSTSDAGPSTSDAGSSSGVPPTSPSDGGPSTSDAGSSPSDGGKVTGCAANCTGKTCGPDGCGGTCGGCPPAQLCGSSQTCVASPGTTSIVVDAKSQGTPISSGIYGVAGNNDDSMQIAALNRWGGDGMSSYNWEIDVGNAGSDWNCANYKGRFTSPTPDSALSTSSDQFVHFNMTKNADTLMTIPMTGWVASIATPNPGVPDCAGSTAIPTCCATLGTSEEQLVDKGSEVLDTSFMSDWVAHLVSTFGSAASGGVKYYQLDNEPDNWQHLRTDVYSSFWPPGTNCEPFYTTNATIGTSLNQDFINRTLAYAKAIKGADPTASVLFMSTENAQDLVALPNDECGNPTGPYNNTDSLTMAILKLAAAEEAGGASRILDCVDMHYPLASSLGATSALWNSASTSTVPYVQGWINSTYPGTGICVSEYNVANDGTNGSPPDATTGTQEADILGMYGRLGYKVAAYWTTLVNGTTQLPVYNAMAMYRNYDGRGGRFGAYSVGAASPNAGVNVYAASDSPTSPTTVWIMLVNVSNSSQDGLSIAVQNFTAASSAKVYRMMAGAAPAADTSVAVSSGSITGFSLAQNSVALLVLAN